MKWTNIGIYKLIKLKNNLIVILMSTLFTNTQFVENKFSQKFLIKFEKIFDVIQMYSSNKHKKNQ